MKSWPHKARELKPDIIKLNHRVTEFHRERTSGVDAAIREWRERAGDLLIGADGLKSVVARQIVGDSPGTYTGDAAWRLMVPVERCRRRIFWSR